MNGERSTRAQSIRSVVRFIRIEQMDASLAYILYNKEHWFLLDQLVRILGPYIDNKHEESGLFCCARGCKEFLLTRDAFRRIGGTCSVYISSCSERYVMDQVYEIMETQRVEEHECQKSTENENENNTPKGFLPRAKPPSVLLQGRSVSQRIRQYTLYEDGTRLEAVLLVDFQSLFALCRLMDKQYHTIASLFLAFSNLCTKRGAARSALTKRDKEKIAAKQEWRCALCDELFDAETRYEVDHGVPLSHGGRSRPSNLWALCISCHGKKSDREMSYPMESL